jgi:hypothetical protein
MRVWGMAEKKPAALTWPTVNWPSLTGEKDSTSCLPTP